MVNDEDLGTVGDKGPSEWENWVANMQSRQRLQTVIDELQDLEVDAETINMNVDGVESKLDTVIANQFNIEDDIETTNTKLQDSTNNFDQLITNSLNTIVKVPGENDYAPERMELFIESSRIFLEYGTDSRYSETFSGRELTPGSDEYIVFRSTDRATYPIGLDLLPSHAFQINGSLQSGDVIAKGFGVPDLRNFDPSTITWEGSTADGIFTIFTEDTGVTEAEMVMVQNGTVVDNYRIQYTSAKDLWARTAYLWNWYDNGPAKEIESYTDTATSRTDPQFNNVVGAVANDDGKGSAVGSHRLVQAVYQASGNSGLSLEVGSMATQIVGEFPIDLRTKQSGINLDNSNTTDGVYEVLGCVKHAEGRESEEMVIQNLRFTNLPSDTTDAEVLMLAVDPSSTNFEIGDFSTPPERNSANTVFRQATATDATGPDAGDSDTDSSGAVQAQTMTNPGGYQIGRAVRSSIAGQGNTSSSVTTGVEEDRRLPDGRWGLLVLDSNETGIHRVQVSTGENT